MQETAMPMDRKAIDRPACISWSMKRKTNAGMPDAKVKITPMTNPDIFPSCIALKTQGNPASGMTVESGRGWSISKTKKMPTPNGKVAPGKKQDGNSNIPPRTAEAKQKIAPTPLSTLGSIPSFISSSLHFFYPDTSSPSKCRAVSKQ